MSTGDLPFAPASERNKRPILEVLKRVLPEQGRLLEIGAGTGQHAVFFAPEFPGLDWQTSDRAEELAGLRARIAREGKGFLPPPVILDVQNGPWPEAELAAIYSANTAHIMAWPAVGAMFAGAGRLLLPGACFCLYGPFNVDGEFTAPSNADFDLQLRARNPSMGLRDVADLVVLAGNNRMDLAHRTAMPSNNFLLVFRRRPGRDGGIHAGHGQRLEP